MIKLTESEMLSLSASLIMFTSLLKDGIDDETLDDLHTVIKKTHEALGGLNSENKSI